MLVRTTFIFSPHSCCVMFSRSMRRRHSYSSTVKTTGAAAGHSPRGANRVFSGRQQTFLHFFGRGIAIPAYCRTNLFSLPWFSDTVALHISSAECEWRGACVPRAACAAMGKQAAHLSAQAPFQGLFFFAAGIPFPPRKRSRLQDSGNAVPAPASPRNTTGRPCAAMARAAAAPQPFPLHYAVPCVPLLLLTHAVNLS